jgi:hypothetical protein
MTYRRTSGRERARRKEKAMGKTGDREKAEVELRRLVTDSYLRRIRRVTDYYRDTGQLEARIACTMVQRGSHIDSLPVEPPLPPIKFSMIEKE